MEQVRSAIAEQDWTRALSTALEAWRETRSIELADLIDRITDRCELPKPPHTRAATQRWWLANAATRDPLLIGALLASWSIRPFSVDTPWDAMRTRWAGNPVVEGVEALGRPAWLSNGAPWHRQIPNWVERVAVMIEWPDDPRVAHVLAQLICDQHAHLDGTGDGPWPAIADKLRALGDRRMAAAFARTPVFSTSYGRHRHLHALHQEYSVQPEPSTELAELLPVAVELPRTADELAPLWHEVGEHPDDDAPRLVLADALLARGDNRGEVIALQCSTDPARRNHTVVQAQRLIKREWERWLGPVALLLANRGTEMRRGMLEVIRVGLSATPTWAWAAVKDHHELVAVREVRPAMVHSDVYAKFVAALPRFPRYLGIDAPEVVHKLAELGPRPLEHACYEPTSSVMYYRRVLPPFAATMTALATLAPTLETLDLGAGWTGGVPTVVTERLELVRALFPALQSIRILEATVAEGDRGSLGSPVELVKQRFSY